MRQKTSHHGTLSLTDTKGNMAGYNVGRELRVDGELIGIAKDAGGRLLDAHVARSNLRAFKCTRLGLVLPRAEKRPTA